MKRSALAGGSDYSLKTISDIINDLKNFIKLIEDDKSRLTELFDKLKKSNQIKKCPPEFPSNIKYGITLFNTCIDEITSIVKDIKNNVRPDHPKRLKNLAEAAIKLAKRMGESWNKYYHPGSENAHSISSKLYHDTRQLAFDLLDLTNLSGRLNDFVGWKNPKGLKDKTTEELTVQENHSKMTSEYELSKEITKTENFTHADNYSTVSLNGKTYQLTKNQSKPKS